MIDRRNEWIDGARINMLRTVKLQVTHITPDIEIKSTGFKQGKKYNKHAESSLGAAGKSHYMQSGKSLLR